MSRFSSHLITAILSGAVTTAVLAVLFPQQHTKPTVVIEQTANNNTAIPTTDNNSAQLLDEQQRTITELQQEIDWLQSVISALDQPTAKPERPTLSTEAQEVWFDEQVLQSLGLPAATIAGIKQTVEEIALEKLNLRHQANREGWGRSRKLREQLRELDQQLTEQLTADEYDLMLYATGKHNRVEVTDTISDSAAGIVGIQAGDVIVSYDGQRIFAPTTLYSATAEGNLGEMTEVIIERNGERITLYVPRGSLGVRFKPVQRPPRP